MTTERITSEFGARCSIKRTAKNEQTEIFWLSTGYGRMYPGYAEVYGKDACKYPTILQGARWQSYPRYVCPHCGFSYSGCEPGYCPNTVSD